MIDPVFISYCRQSIDDMRRHGMNDVIIACVLSEVRAAGILEERRRIAAIYKANPPDFRPSGEMKQAIAPD
jgi:hypothetical protein